MTAVGLDREDAYHPAHELALKMLCAGEQADLALENDDVSLACSISG